MILLTPSEKLLFFNHRNEKVKSAASNGFLQCHTVSGLDYQTYTLWYTTSDTETDWIRGYAWLDTGRWCVFVRDCTFTMMT